MVEVPWPQACRWMVRMFDKDQSGHIDFNEYSQLHHYMMQV